MELKETTQQVLDFQKQVLDNWDAAATLMENQATSTLDWMLDSAVWMPKEGRRAMEQWMTVLKEERGRLKAHLDQGLTTAEKIFAPSQTPATTTPKSTTIKKKKETPDESV
jgi:hypothetical protein